MMRQIKNIIRDVLYVSKITKVNNKKILIFFVTILSQFTALTDIAIIAIFASIIANQFTNIDFVNEIILFILDFKIILVFVVLAVFIFIYYQQVLIKNLEFNVKQNLKVYLLNEIFEKWYSVADAYFVNTIWSYIIFYSNFVVLQIYNNSYNLLMVDLQSIGIF